MHQIKCGIVAKEAMEGVCIPSPIDTSIFNKENAIKEEDSVIWVGSIAPHKGFNKLIDYAKVHSEKHIRVVSFDYQEMDIPSNVEIIGEKHGKELAELYKESEMLFHHPEQEAFGRTVMEAYLCGCKLDLNENVGAMSYDWDYTDYNEVKSHLQSEVKFWREIDSAMSKLEKI